MATLRGVLDRIAAFIDQDTTLASGTELIVRVNLVNQAQDEWGEAYQWKQLRTKFAPTVLYSMTSIGLPANFKKLMSAPYNAAQDVANEYQEINPSDRFTKLPTDRYCYISGNDADGKALIVHPALSSGVSLVMDMQTYPSSVATLQDVLTCPSPQYVTKRTLAYILESRSDPRFPSMKAESDDMLANMIEEEQTPSGAENNKTQDLYTATNFRIGRE